MGIECHLIVVPKIFHVLTLKLYKKLEKVKL